MGVDLVFMPASLRKECVVAVRGLGELRSGELQEIQGNCRCWMTVQRLVGDEGMMSVCIDDSTGWAARKPNTPSGTETELPKG